MSTLVYSVIAGTDNWDMKVLPTTQLNLPIFVFVPWQATSSSQYYTDTCFSYMFYTFQLDILYTNKQIFIDICGGLTAPFQFSLFCKN